MGRGKIEIKRIENSTNRQVTFSKRKNGIIKKAKEISVLCDAEVSVVIFASSGKMYEFCSPKTSVSRLLEKYQTNSGKKLWEPKHEALSIEIERVKKENDSMQLELRHMRGEDLAPLNPTDLISIEASLQNGITGVRDKQMEVWRMMRKKDKMLEEEHKMLQLRAHQQDMALNGDVNNLVLRYHRHNDREFAPQVPLGFRLQPDNSG